VQPVSVFTDRMTEPPSADTVVFAGETANLHGAGSCETATCEPFTSIAPRRDEGTPFASTRYVTAPLPCPDFADVMVIHAADDDAVHVQSRVVLTAICPVDPDEGTVGTPLSTVT